MGATSTTVQLVGVGGTAPYTFAYVSVVPPGYPDAGISSTIQNDRAIISNSQLTVNAAPNGSLSSPLGLPPGPYTVVVSIADANFVSLLATPENISYLPISVKIVDPSLFSILTESTAYEPISFPSTQSLALVYQNPVTNIVVSWSLIPSVTTLPGVSITGSTLNFTLTGFGSWTVGLRATDALQNVVTKVITISVASAAVYQLVDGQLEVKVTPPTTKVGTHSFSAIIHDSNGGSVTQQFTYSVLSEISDIFIEPFNFDHFWGAGDKTQVTFPILGNFAGFSLGPSSITTPANGLVVSVDPNTNTVSVSGPPTAFQNSEVIVPLNIQSGTTPVATVSRAFTLLSHNGSTDTGVFTCFTRPYSVGQFVSLNPQKPYFNSPSIFKNASYSVRVQSGSVLPNGLSLDQNTGLIYGPVQDNLTTQSIIEFYDSSAVVHATITIKWDIQVSQFQLVDSLTVGQIQQTYSASLAPVSTAALVNASIYRGRLPAGLTISVNTSLNTVVISGTPTESGYFDIWIAATNSSQQTAYFYKRFVVDYIPPLVILTNSLPSITTQAYSVQLQAYGGVSPYTWSSPQWPGGVNSNFPGFTLSTSGQISGTYSGTPANGYTENDTFVVTDQRGVTASASLAVNVNTTLTITTPVLPNVVPNQPYSLQLQATGGSGIYNPPAAVGWSISSGSLPSGIVLSTSGVLSGVTSVTIPSTPITIHLVDSVGNSASQSYTLNTGLPSGLIIDTSGIDPVPPGGPYQGTLRAAGTYTLPITWSVAAITPNPLSFNLGGTNVSNLSLNNGDSNDAGATATVSGSATANFNNYSVMVQAVDANGQSSFAFMILNSLSTLAIVTSSLPAGVIGTPYSFQLAASGFNPPFTWTNVGSLPSGFTISGSGILTNANPTAAINTPITIQVTDNLGATAQKTLQLIVQSSLLAITTSSISPVIAGRPYSFTLNASGGTPFAGPSYLWAVSPVSANTLPTGISLSPTTGVLSGSSSLTGFNQSIIFRVTDSLGAFTDKALTVMVNSGLALFTGIDYVDGTNLGILGYVVQGDVSTLAQAPNDSFQVIATGVLATSPGQLAATTTNSNIAATVLSIVSGVATIKLTGVGFDLGSAGSNSVGVSVTDLGGSIISKTFTWTVYSDGTLTFGNLSSFPTLVVGP